MRRRLFAAVVLVSALAAAGCTSTGSNDDSPSLGGPYPVTVPTPGGPVTVDKQPKRIVSLSPSSTEMLFAMGAGKQVTAVDKYSNYPADVPTDQLDGFQPNAEAISGKNPDLVVLAYDANGIVAALRALKIPVYLAAAAVTIEDVYLQMADLGRLTGHVAATTDRIEGMKFQLKNIIAAAPKRDKRLTYYYELDPQLHSATSSTFIGALLGKLGLDNIADGAAGAAGGYPQLSAEAVIKANPDYVFLADTKCCQANKATVAARPGWALLSAVKNDQVVELDDDVASRWGPRVFDLLNTVSSTLKSAK